MALNLVRRELKNKDDVLYMSFNQDHTCFAIGTDAGFRIYNCDPFRETFRRKFPNGGIGIVEMLFRCNILALVGGGKTPCFPTNKVKLWDDHTMQVIGDMTFKDEVRAVKLRRDKVVVATANAVFVYSFDKLEIHMRHNTEFNPLGIFALSPSSSRCVLACPALQRGVVRVEDSTEDKGGFTTAHDSALAMLALNADGTLMATASEKGTLIRVFDTSTTDKLVKELRRGSERGLIYSLCFSADNRFLACSSSHGTIHVFALGDVANEEASANANNRKSVLSVLQPISSWFGSEWSFSWYNGPDCATVCVFGSQSDVLHVLGADGTFLKLTFDPVKGGECVRRSAFRFPTQ
ncbi:Autophagy-related protein 18a [Diplonema papillatum]|nr:Autophagy-related protein 18a [Diplonema papillatum]